MNKYINSFLFNENIFYYCDLNKIFKDYPSLKTLPNSLKILLESNIRNAKDEQIEKIINIFLTRNKNQKINIFPTRVILEDLIGIPLMVDFISIRQKMISLGVSVEKLEPNVMIDLIIDHSLKVEKFSTYDSYEVNLENEIKNNKDRYEFVKWVENQFDKFSVIPSGVGTLNQLNLEYLATLICVNKLYEKYFIYPEVLLSSDSYISMSNTLGVLSLKSSEIDLKSLFLGLTLTSNLPKVIGIKLIGSLKDDININSVAISLLNILLKEKYKEHIYIEFFGEALNGLSFEDRAVLCSLVSGANIKVSYFAIDDITFNYLQKTRGVDVSIIKEYFSLQGMYLKNQKIEYDEIIEFNLTDIEMVVSEPIKVQDKLLIKKIPSKLQSFKSGNLLKDNDIVLALLTSSISTINPKLIIQAALLAKNAISLGLEINPNIKTIFSPGSISVKKYLEKLDLLKYFEELGFNIVGFSTSSYFGNSGDLFVKIEEEIKKYNLDVSCVTSGNVDRKKIIHPLIKSNWFMSPALVIAFCLKGSVNCNILEDEISKGIFLKDILPDNAQVEYLVNKIDTSIYLESYKNISQRTSGWKNLKSEHGVIFNWDINSKYIQNSKVILENQKRIFPARILAAYSQDLSFEDILPNIDERKEGNEENILKKMYSSNNLKNTILEDEERVYTKDIQFDEVVSIYDYSSNMKNNNIPLIVYCNGFYAKGINRSLIAKATALLGIKAIIAKKFDKNHKIDLIKYGVLPLELIEPFDEDFTFRGDEEIIFDSEIKVLSQEVNLKVKKLNNEIKNIKTLCKIETIEELKYYEVGGIIPYIIKNLY